MKISSRASRAMLLGFASLTLVSVLTATAVAQTGPAADRAAPHDNYLRRLALGFGASILAHETAHILTSIAVGAHPYIAFDKGRPTVFSGIDSERHPHKQFIFSAAGLTTQALINEAVLDIQHSRGGAIERGVLTGGISTTLFYISLGRDGSVSDIA